MAFTTESKYGYQDGEHFANWSTQYPIFARVINNVLYALGREDNPDNTARFGKVFKMSRDWMKQTIFADTPSDADFFADSINNQEDTSVPGNQFIKSTDLSQVISRPDPALANFSLPNLPTGDPATPTQTKTTDTAKLPSDLLSNVQSAMNPAGDSSWRYVYIMAALVGIVAIVGGIVYAIKQRNK